MSEFSVVLAPAAESDIEEAFHWYEERDAGAASAFRREAFEAIDQLALDPMRWRADGNGNRRRLLKRFPYSVWFEVQAEIVTVLAVAHRHPHGGAGRQHSPVGGVAAAPTSVRALSDACRCTMNT